ncbi:peptidase family M48-domain-containing protein [Dichotomocladium elegans]|nr:peptidase family M48-domain-containing protein [Dichotomocladium elegans]
MYLPRLIPRPSSFRISPVSNSLIRTTGLPAVQWHQRTMASMPPLPHRFQRTPIRVTVTPTAGGGYRRFNQHQPFYRSKRLWVFVGTGTIMFGGYYMTHLETVPITGRLRFMNVTSRQEEAMAKQAYQEVMSQFGHKILPQYDFRTRFVARIAKRIVQVSGMENLHWEFHVIDSPEPNAFVLPGGKVFVFTGILPIVQNEDGMAAVLGHEIAHQLARHSAEKLSFAKVMMAVQLTLLLLGIDPTSLVNQLALNFVIDKPFSRKCETEADAIGLQLMAQACFDPHEAVSMWKRMEKAGAGNIPQFMSTHPSHKNRMAFLEKEMPSALAKRAESDCTTELKQYADMFNNAWARW